MQHTDSEEARGKGAICPYCGSGETELLSLFGQQLLTVQYYCHACHTPFEHIKDDEVFDERAEARPFGPGDNNDVFH